MIFLISGLVFGKKLMVAGTKRFHASLGISCDTRGVPKYQSRQRFSESRQRKTLIFLSRQRILHKNDCNSTIILKKQIAQLIKSRQRNRYALWLADTPGDTGQICAMRSGKVGENVREFRSNDRQKPWTRDALTRDLLLSFFCTPKVSFKWQMARIQISPTTGVDEGVHEVCIRVYLGDPFGPIDHPGTPRYTPMYSRCVRLYLTHVRQGMAYV